MEFDKAGLAHHTAAHHASGDAHLAERLYGIALSVCGRILKLCHDVDRESVGRKFCGWIWVDAHILHGLEIVSAVNLLL